MDIKVYKMSAEEQAQQSSRRISFPPEAIFQSVIQDGDNHELWNILNNRDHLRVDINHHNHTGVTALHQSVLNNNMDAVKLLLNSGADVNMADTNGLTPLHTASACGFTQTASFLLIFGANLFAQTTDGDLPVDFAKDTDMVHLLQGEMISQIHSRNYVSSLVYHKTWESLLWCCRTGVVCAGKCLEFLVFQCKVYMKRKRRKDEDDADETDNHSKSE